MYDVLIAGGGLAGLVNAIQLAKAGLQVVLVEKKQYPFHKVCGEYISNEVRPFLHSMSIHPESLGASTITHLQVSSVSGKRVLTTELDLGGFGLSRYVLDEHLYKKARDKGASFMLGKSVEKISFSEDCFKVELSDGQVLQSKLVIGAFGKRSRLDKQLNRPFINERSPYIGVKYHIRTNFPPHLIALHNFKDGYCGVCAIEDHIYNMCYLTTRHNLKQYGTLEELESHTLYKNLLLQQIKQDAEFLYDKPEVINEISFAPKKAVENHILMSGDAAGLITPLCGNGMAMAIHSAKILSEQIIEYFTRHRDRNQLEYEYTRQWQQLFARRLWAGRQIQQLFGSEWLSSMAVMLLQSFTPATRFLIKQTHGKVF